MLNQDDIVQLRNKYDSRIGLFNQLIKTVKFIISQETQNHQMKYHSFIHRIKPFDSFVEKIRRKDAKEPFQEIMDVVGLRIVCLFHSNVKDIGTIVEKNFEVIEKDDKEPFQEIMDVVGLRIVCLFHSNVKDIGTIVEKNFEVIEKDDKIDGVDVNIFGYMSLHYKAKLKDVSSDSYYKNIKDIPFEIQIRTIAQDAWGFYFTLLGLQKRECDSLTFKA